MGQKELADSIKLLGDRIREIETELRALKAELLLEAVKETQHIVNAVQGGLNQRIEALSVKVSIIEKERSELRAIEHHSMLPKLPKPPSGDATPD